MELITTIDELRENARTLDSYLKSDNMDKKEFAKDLIKKGKCFVIFDKNGELCFYPSRFLGYVDNTQEKHNYGRNHKLVKGGRTSKCISRLLNCSEIPNKEFEIIYERFCTKEKISANRIEHKFWAEKITL